jgi:hypothetical protein
VEGRGKDGEFKSLLILEDCIFLLEFIRIKSMEGVAKYVLFVRGYP